MRCRALLTAAVMIAGCHASRSKVLSRRAKSPAAAISLSGLGTPTSGRATSWRWWTSTGKAPRTLRWSRHCRLVPWARCRTTPSTRCLRAACFGRTALLPAGRFGSTCAIQLGPGSPDPLATRARSAIHTALRGCRAGMSWPPSSTGTGEETRPPPGGLVELDSAGRVVRYAPAGRTADRHHRPAL